MNKTNTFIFKKENERGAVIRHNEFLKKFLSYLFSSLLLYLTH